MAKVKITGHASGTGILTVTAPNTSTDRTITLPDATGTLLNSDGSGASLTGLTSSQMPAGSVLQVVQAVKTDTFSYTGSVLDSPETYTDVTGLTVDITPSATSSKILVLVNALHASEGDSFLSLFRDTTNLASPTSPGNRTPALSGNGRKSDGADNIYAHSISFLDSPNTTSATTYKVAITVWSDDTAYINRTVGDADAGNRGRCVSTITAMEIGA